MKKVLFFSAMALFSTIISAQDYQISFAILGDDETLLDSVVVHNVDQGNMITIRGNEILHLVSSTTGLTTSKASKGRIKVYPNPFSDRATIEFQNDNQGVVQLSLFDMAGKLVAQNRLFYAAGKTIAELRGVPVGAYVIQIDTETSIFSEVILSNVVSGKNPEIIFKGSENDATASVPILKSSDATGELIEMQYNEGDTLSLTAYLGNLILEVKNVPEASSTIHFDFHPKVEDIAVTEDITPYGGTLQVSDESGNLVTITFPPGAVMDTTTVTLTLSGEQSELPIDERQLRTFEIRPLEINLYEPVVITIEYITPISEIEKSALFRVRSDERLTPLSDHSYPEDKSSMTATTLFFGEFAEGTMTLEQVNTQFDLLISSLGISWKKSQQSMQQETLALSDCGIYKEAWDNWKESIGGFLSFFELRIMRGHYDNLPPGQNTLEEDLKLLCENVVGKGVQEVLDMGMPEDPCCRDYRHTIASMLESMMFLDCDQNPVYDLVDDRFNEVLNDCSASLTINSEMNIQGGGFVVLTTGVVPITVMTSDDAGMAPVEGSGTLSVGGSVEGSCTNTISGTTIATITGTRDAAHIYLLTIMTQQNAVLTSVCPDRTITTALVGSGSRTITLSEANGFSVTIDELVDEGTFTMEITLENSYTD